MTDNDTDAKARVTARAHSGLAWARSQGDRLVRFLFGSRSGAQGGAGAGRNYHSVKAIQCRTERSPLCQLTHGPSAAFLAPVALNGLAPKRFGPDVPLSTPSSIRNQTVTPINMKMQIKPSVFVFQLKET
jgi:hypothetical protein